MHFRTPHRFLLLPLFMVSPFSPLLRLLSTHPKPHFPLFLALLLCLSGCNSTIHTHGGWLRRSLHCEDSSCFSPDVSAARLIPIPDELPSTIYPTLAPQPPEPSAWESNPPEIEILPPFDPNLFPEFDSFRPGSTDTTLVLFRW